MQPGFHKDVQGLRAIAVALVILTHFGVSALPGGHIGVDVFFVISGYLITGLLIREHRTNGKIDLVRFYSRRMKRLAPVMLVMILTSVLATLTLLSDYTLLHQGSSLPYALTWTSNLYFAFTEADYFNELHNLDLFIHTWSLGVEEQFYLVWPLLLLGLAARKRHDGKVLLSLLVIAALSYAVCLALSRTHPVMAFYMMPARIWQFALGGIVWLAVSNSTVRVSLTNTLPQGRNLLALLAIAAILIPAFLITERTLYPGTAAIAPTIGAALSILLARLDKNPVASILSSPPAVWLGDRSYSLYLWHWPIWIVGMQWLSGDMLINSMILGCITLLVADVSYRFIELPFWKGRLSVWKADRTPLVACLILVAVSSALAAHQLSSLKHSNFSEATEFASRAASDVPVIYSYGCDTWYHSSDVTPCIMGQPQKGHIVFVGDSIGLQWFSMVPEIFSQAEWQLTVLTKSACPIVDEEVFYPRINAMYEVCHQWRDKVIPVIREINPDILFIGSSALYDFTQEQWQDGTRRILDALQPRRALIIAPTPQLAVSGPSCIANTLVAKNSKGLADVYERCASEMGSRVGEITTWLQQASANYDNVTVLDFNEIVCPNGHCTAVTPDGIAVYRDSLHLTNSFVVSQAEKIREIIDINTP